MEIARRIAWLVTMVIVVGCEISMAPLVIEGVDLATVADGTYRGTYEDEPTGVRVKVDVTVEDHAITAIEILEHTCSSVGDKGEKVVGRIIDAQTVEVDAVTGATVSSKVIMKAVSLALLEGVEEPEGA